jgi:hypothetical protein
MGQSSGPGRSGCGSSIGVEISEGELIGVGVLVGSPIGVSNGVDVFVGVSEDVGIEISVWVAVKDSAADMALCGGISVIHRIIPNATPIMFNCLLITISQEQIFS